MPFLEGTVGLVRRSPLDRFLYRLPAKGPVPTSPQAHHPVRPQCCPWEHRAHTVRDSRSPRIPFSAYNNMSTVEGEELAETTKTHDVDEAQRVDIPNTPVHAKESIPQDITSEAEHSEEVAVAADHADIAANVTSIDSNIEVAHNEGGEDAIVAKVCTSCSPRRVVSQPGDSRRMPPSPPITRISWNPGSSQSSKNTLCSRKNTSMRMVPQVTQSGVPTMKLLLQRRRLRARH